MKAVKHQDAVSGNNESETNINVNWYFFVRDSITNDHF